MHLFILMWGSQHGLLFPTNVFRTLSVISKLRFLYIASCLLLFLPLQSGAQEAVSAMQAGIETAGDSVENADSTGTSLNNITQAIGSISDLSIQVATATEQQSSVVNELNSHILNIKNMSDNTANEAKTINQKCDELNTSSTQLTGMVNNFKI